MKVFIIFEQVKLYEPSTIEECDDILCNECVFHKYNIKGFACPFKKWLADKPAMAKRCYPTCLKCPKRKT